MAIFGWEFKKKKQNDILKKQEIVAPLTDDIPNEIFAGGDRLVSTYNHLTAIPKDEIDLILKYRSISFMPEVAKAISEITTDAITEDANLPDYVKLDLDEVELSDSIKEKIIDEFNYILRLLKFKRKANTLFRNWYIDGRMYHHIIVDGDKQSDGIKKISYIDSLQIKKYRQIEKDKDGYVQSIDDFYVYCPHYDTVNVWKDGNFQDKNIYKLTDDAVNFVPSGVVSERRDVVISHLHKAIKTANQLGMLEDAAVVYKIVRAPQRRVFYIDVGDLPKTKAEQYIKNIMTRFRTKITYDSKTGQIDDNKENMSVLDDMFLPRRNGNSATEVDTLQGADTTGTMDDLEYFKKKLYEALNVPTSRLENDAMFNLGRSSEITRNEVKFAKFISYLQKQFAYGLFGDLLGKQVILKKIMTEDEWKEHSEKFVYKFSEDSFFSEIKKIEIMKERMDLLDSMVEHEGIYFSRDMIRKKVLQQTDEEIKELAKEREADRKSNDNPPEDE